MYFLKWLMLGLSLVMIFPVFGQVKRASSTYPNNQPKHKGKYLYCITPDTLIRGLYNHEKRPFGKWIDYHENGQIKRIRNYSKKGRGCKAEIFKHGNWEYFNENGEHYLTESYRNDSLVLSEIDIYEKDIYKGKLINPAGVIEWTTTNEEKDSDNLIPNPSFDQYFFKPIPIENYGSNQIDQLIPYWHSPDNCTPDYYNTHRHIANVSQHLNPNNKASRTFGYVGLMLFMGDQHAVNAPFEEKTLMVQSNRIDYNESIQVKLKEPLEQNSKYCFKVRLILSDNAGYAIDRMGVIMSRSPITYHFQDAPKDPDISLSLDPDESSQWQTYCGYYDAKGGESFLTIGRFSSLEETSVIEQSGWKKSSLDINRSAYYLLDEVSFFDVSDPSGCSCEMNPEKNKEEDSNYVPFEQSNGGNTYLFTTIYFDHDDYAIKESFIPELEKLIDFLNCNPQISIKILGHADTSGDEKYNLSLSVDRAKAVAEWLVKREILEDRVLFEGFGDSKPINKTENEANRRVEFEIIHQ